MFARIQIPFPMKTYLKISSCLLVLLLAGSAMAGKVIEKSIVGTPSIGRINVISFAPGGVLLIGDGTRRQIIAVETGDIKPINGKLAGIKGIAGKIAGRLGAKAGGIEVIDLAVNPSSGRLYVAVRKQDDKSYLVVRIGPSGGIDHYDLRDVRHAVVPLPKGEKAPVSSMTDVAWAGDRLVASARCNEEFGAKIFSTEGALVHGKTGQLFSAETYHVSHRKWETKAPMSVLIPYEENGKQFIVGAFSCTPVVKYPIDDLKPGAKIKGISMIELGSGNRPLDMFAYEKDGKESVLANTYRFHHERRPISPGPYWATRFDQRLLAEGEKINENAVRRLGKGSKPSTDLIEMVDSFHGVVQMDRLDKNTAVAIKQAGEDFDLITLALP
jgi:hypothetical protein